MPDKKKITLAASLHPGKSMATQMVSCPKTCEIAFASGSWFPASFASAGTNNMIKMFTPKTFNGIENKLCTHVLIEATTGMAAELVNRLLPSWFQTGD
mmetsp:Transcript_121527/g.170988  ORF Transcript_121527/g.170988 Transcript_121527/m.170988 type:complete len:98 (+) Transcript_121527:718-1011(+)